MDSLKIGLIQPKIYFDNAEVSKYKGEAKSHILRIYDEKNYRHALELLGNFDPHDVDLIVFPERYPGEATLSISQRDELKDEARRIGAYIIAGETYRPKKDELPFNSVVTINPKGKIVSRYNKIQRWVDEVPYLAAGSVNQLKPVSIHNVPVGVMICSDIEIKEYPETLVKKGAELLVFVASISPAYADWWTEDLAFFARRLKVPIVFVNPPLLYTGTGYFGGGGSKVVLPYSAKMGRELTLDDTSSAREPMISSRDQIALELSQWPDTGIYSLRLKQLRDFRKKSLLFKKR